MALYIRDIDYDRAVRFIASCPIDTTNRVTPITVTDDARAVLAEVAAEERETSKAIIDEFEYDDFGQPLRTGPQQAFQSMVGRIAGYLMFEAVQRHDRALAYREGRVLEAMEEFGSGLHHASVAGVHARQAEKARTSAA